MPRFAVLLAVLIGAVFVAFLGLLGVSELATRRREAKTGWAFIKSDGSVSIPGPFEAVTPFRQGLAAAKRDERWGFIDTTGREVVPFRFEDVGSFSPEGLAPAREGRRWGYIRRDGTWAIPPRYDEAAGFGEGRACVGNVVGLRPGKYPSHRIYSYTMIDPDGRETVPIRLQDDPLRLARLEALSEGLAVLRMGDDGRYGFVDRAGSLTIPRSFAAADPFREGLAVVGKDRYGFLRPDGSRPFDAVFAWARPFSGGYAAVRTGAGADARWGFIDSTGRIVVEPTYLDVGAVGPTGGFAVGFSEERAAVAIASGRLDRRWSSGAALGNRLRA